MNAKQRAIRDHLRSLERTHDGHLTPEVVVTDAQNPNSPIHDKFIWDDAKAAAVQRLDTARELIRSIRYEETVTEIELDVPNYVHVTLPGEPQGYMPMDRVKKEKELSKEVMSDELKRACAAVKRTRGVADALGLLPETEAILQRLIRLHKLALAA